MPVTRQNLQIVFSYHAPTADHIVKLQRVRDAARAFAEILLDEVPQCADQQDALRLIRESVMTANAAIVLNGEV
jgi:hypothetical protein